MGALNNVHYILREDTRAVRTNDGTEYELTNEYGQDDFRVGVALQLAKEITGRTQSEVVHHHPTTLTIRVWNVSSTPGEHDSPDDGTPVDVDSFQMRKEFVTDIVRHVLATRPIFYNEMYA